MDHFFYLLEFSLPVSFHLEDTDTTCRLNQEGSHGKPYCAHAPDAILPFSIENCAETRTTGKTRTKTQSVCLPKETVEAQVSGKV